MDLILSYYVFDVDGILGTNPLDMEAFLTSPTGKTDLCEISDLEDSLYDIKFSPAEEGVHTVSLKHRGMHCSGSPHACVQHCDVMQRDVISWRFFRLAFPVHCWTSTQCWSVQG